MLSKLLHVPLAGKPKYEMPRTTGRAKLIDTSLLTTPMWLLLGFSLLVPFGYLVPFYLVPSVYLWKAFFLTMDDTLLIAIFHLQCTVSALALPPAKVH
jgi:hypothetical protein